MERPCDLLARAQVWSNYKHLSTVKILMGITPQGDDFLYFEVLWRKNIGQGNSGAI